MITRAQWTAAHGQAMEMLRRSGVRLLGREVEAVQVLDFDLGDWETSGVGMLVLLATPAIVVKLLALQPGQTCPEHRHVAAEGIPAKEETWRCAWGELVVGMPGEPTDRPRAVLPTGREQYYTSRREIVLAAGEQFTSPGDTPHWFQGGPDGAVTWAFETPSPFACGIFTDPAVTDPVAKIED